jgi:Immunity protein 8
MELEIKNYFFHSIDFRKGPDDPHKFYEDFCVDIGEVGKEGVTNYCLFVCTPSGIEELIRKTNEPYYFGRDMLIVKQFDMEVILKAVRDHIHELEKYAQDVT